MISQRRFVACATISALTSCLACAPKTAGRTNAPPPVLAALQGDLNRVFAEPTLEHAQWSVDVRSPSRGDSLFRLNAQRLQVPASSQKVLTTAVAVATLGWDFRYTTQILGTSPIVNGTLDGDLIVRSDGDPSINPRHPDREHVFDDWAQRLADSGLRRVTGRLVGDDNAFAEPGWGLGWSWDDFALGYAAPVGALQFHESDVDVIVSPAREPGARALVSLLPLGSGLALDNTAVTVAAGGASRITIDRAPGARVLAIRGQIALDAAAVSESAAPLNPTEQYLNALRDALARHGIFVSDGVADIDEVPLAGSASERVLIEDRSPPLEELVATCLKFSRNLYAETFLRTLAVHSPRLAVLGQSSVLGPQSVLVSSSQQDLKTPSPPDLVVAGHEATADEGLQILRDTLTSWGISSDGYLARDGSGLSRYDWVSAQTLAGVLSHLARDPRHADRFKNALAVPAQPGTLESRMKGTAAESRVWAKTGSMSQVRSLSGYVITRDNEQLVVAIVINGFRVPAREVDAVMDRALVRIAEFSRK